MNIVFPATPVFVTFHHWVTYRETLFQRLSYVGYNNAAFALGLSETRLLYYQYLCITIRPRVVFHSSTRRSPPRSWVRERECVCEFTAAPSRLPKNHLLEIRYFLYKPTVVQKSRSTATPHVVAVRFRRQVMACYLIKKKGRAVVFCDIVH